MSIRNKLVIAFGLLFVAAIGGMGVVAMRAVSDAVEAQFVDQAENGASLFSRWNPPAEPAFVANALRRVYGADVAVLDDAGRWGSTLDVASRTAVEAAADGALRPVPGGPRAVPWRLADGRRTFAVAVPYRPREAGALDTAPERPPGLLILFHPATRVEDEISRARQPLLAVVLGGLLLVTVLGVGIAHSITRPLDRLVQRTREVGAGHLTDSPDDGPRPTEAGPATGAGGGDEVAQLAGSFDRMVEGLRRYQADLLRSEQLAVAGRMAAGIAHEIRNPLAAMRMTVELHAREEADAERRQALALLRTEIDRIEEAVAELMDLANPAAPRREPVDLNAVVEEVLSLTRPQADHQGVSVETRLASDARVTADPRRLRRVVMNLVLNALQAMPGRGRLTVETERRGADIRLGVADTGPGVPADLRDRVFEPFVSGKTGGAGLGLAVSRRIVEDHGGRIGFETGEGGARFWVELGAVTA